MDDDVSNHRRLDCLLTRLFRRRSKNTSNLRVTGLCEGNPSVIGGFPSQGASNVENVAIWWRHHGNGNVMLTTFSPLNIVSWDQCILYCSLSHVATSETAMQWRKFRQNHFRFNVCYRNSHDWDHRDFCFLTLTSIQRYDVMMFVCCHCNDTIDKSHKSYKSHIAAVPYPTMHCAIF